MLEACLHIINLFNLHNHPVRWMSTVIIPMCQLRKQAWRIICTSSLNSNDQGCNPSRPPRVMALWPPISEPGLPCLCPVKGADVEEIKARVRSEVDGCVIVFACAVCICVEPGLVHHLISGYTKLLNLFLSFLTCQMEKNLIALNSS